MVAGHKPAAAAGSTPAGVAGTPVGDPGSSSAVAAGTTWLSCLLSLNCKC